MRFCKLKYLIIVFLIQSIAGSDAFSQNKIDSVAIISNLSIPDSVKIDRLWRYSSITSKQGDALEESGFIKAKEIAQKIKNYRLEAFVNDNYAYNCQMKGLNNKAYGLYMENLAFSHKYNDSLLWLKANYKLGYLFTTSGNNEKAIPYFELAEKYAKKNAGKANACIAIGSCYLNLKNNKKAIEYLNKALYQLKASEKLTYQHAFSHSNLATIYISENDLAKAEEHVEKGLAAAKEINDQNIYSMMVLDKARITNKKGRHQEALGLLISVKDIILKDFDDFKKNSLEYEFYLTYKALNEPEKALVALSKAYALKETLYNAENSKTMNDLEQKYQNKNKQLEIENQKLMLHQKESEKNFLSEQKRKQTYIFFGITLFLILNGIFIYNRYRKSKRDSEIILNQKNLILEKQNEILDSISYAKRLQEAIIPSDSYWNQKLKESFVFYKPKDIVAGDFYWMEINNNILHFAAADCTGHGVPGAMVSVICSNALNRAIKEFKLNDPGKILDKVRELVIETFEKSSSDVYDGMDISLCSLNLENGQLFWAGANNPIWIRRAGTERIEEVKPNKQPIGKFALTSPFTTHHIDLKPNDVIYIFTDGFADQFGGPKGKKFKYKQLQELLLANSNESMEFQKQKLDAVFNSWKGNLEQIDDVCVIGVKL